METIKIAGVEFVSPDCCAFGDYGGSGSLGLANIRTIVEDERAGEVCDAFFGSLEYDERVIEAVKAGAVVIHATGGYSSECVYLRADSELANETLEALENYPALDDELMSQIELDWESEAWDSWLESDLRKAAFPDWYFGDDTEAAENAYEALEDSAKFEAYRVAMESVNEYPVAEYSGVWVDVKRIAAVYAAEIAKLLAPKVS